MNNDLNLKGAANVISNEKENNSKVGTVNKEIGKNKIIYINKIRNELKETKDKINISDNKKLSANKGNDNYIKLSQIKITPTITPNKDITKKINIENNIKNESLDNLTNIEKNKAKDVNEMFYINETKNEDKLEDIIVPNELSNDVNVTNSLRKNLFQEKVGKYFESQKLKYLKIYKNDKDLIKAINNLSIKHLRFKFNSKEMKYHNIRKALQEIMNLFSNSDNILNPDYGFFVCDKKILFFSSDNSNQESEILYNLNYLRQMDYDYAAMKESSIKANTKDKDPNKVDYFLIKGLDFEKNWEFFFDYSFNMKKLPNIFFPVKTILDYKIHGKKKSELGGFYKFNDTKSNQLDNKEFNLSDNNKSITETKVEITFQEYIKNIFKTFIEIDFARLNDQDYDMQPQSIYKPYINEPSIHVYQKENNEWTHEINQTNDFTIYSKSIVLGEIKHTVPDKVININEKEYINILTIQRALYFVLYKLIKKMTYYINYVEYEILNKNEKIKDYKIQLFLVYNNKPINKMNQYIITCIDNLIKNKYINNEFYFQIIYSAPSISSLNLNNLSKKINKLESDIEMLKKKMDEMSENKKNEKK